MKTLCVKIPLELYREVERRRGAETKSNFIRIALEDYINNQKEKEESLLRVLEDLNEEQSVLAEKLSDILQMVLILISSDARKKELLKMVFPDVFEKYFEG